MDIKEKQAWRTIVAVLQETGYDKLYDEEFHIVAECLRRCEQQCKKQKEVIDKIEKLVIEYLEHDYSSYYENEIEVELINDISNILKEVSK